MTEKEIRLHEMDVLAVFLRETAIQNNLIQGYVSQRRLEIEAQFRDSKPFEQAPAQGTQSPVPDASKGQWHS